ncbi:NAD(P)/FAD-dependent oxidoreductase [Noviherbaspirillum saxi]|uniref:NAD(P)/FAD-dependent oxidoreductase n=1 Tax=Noviherbaspirillum saxi TaxID=2320863 RepID=A0A3A3FWZ6_9BURK|nr:NAD(P)/FAD-dependent oxidoreductase [Noviherbaspirillum saxi]RJF99188.1 NAD(P)/FAD-dependent oxidoreductase [Noviherbaspirillum saxi]
MQTIVIAGGGAGGLELATRLGDSLGKSGRARIVLIDRSPTHFWKPLLHTVASGKRDPQMHEVEYSAQAAEHGFQFVCGEVLGVDRASRKIAVGPYRSDDGAEVLPARSLPYDKLVLAFGAVTNFFNIAGAAEHSLTLDSVWQAEQFRKRFLASCMQASSRRTAGATEGAVVNIVIVGGGATGVELAAELSHTVRTLAQYNVHTLDPGRDVRVSIIERSELLLPHLNPRLAKRAARYLGSLGVAVCTGTTVARVDADAVLDTDGIRHASDITLWAAGVEGPAVCTTLGLPVNRLKQIVVNAGLQSPEDADVFAIGDCSSYVCPEKGAAVPPRAQVAHQQAMYLADVLARKPDEEVPDFQYRDYGSLVSLGPFAAVGSLLGSSSGREMLVGGVTARLLYSLMYQKHVMALHGFIRMAAQTVVHWLRGKVSPPVKLH